jgi:hypothetical protein
MIVSDNTRSESQDQVFGVPKELMCFLTPSSIRVCGVPIYVMTLSHALYGGSCT